MLRAHEVDDAPVRQDLAEATGLLRREEQQAQRRLEGQAVLGAVADGRDTSRPGPSFLAAPGAASPAALRAKRRGQDAEGDKREVRAGPTGYGAAPIACQQGACVGSAASRPRVRPTGGEQRRKSCHTLGAGCPADAFGPRQGRDGRLPAG